jgi:phosphoribosylanthranilate isomerase
MRRRLSSAAPEPVGFVFWPGSPRCIDPYRARAIAATLPPFVTAVGVFDNQPAAVRSHVAALVRLGAVQLHGDETVADAAGVATPVIKAVTVADPQLSVWSSRTLLLVDVHDPEKRGGTGRTVDCPRRRRIAAQRRSLLAGGLTPENVGDAIACVRPFGIDVSSGVETSPGVKDHRRLRALFEAVNGTSAFATRS